MIDVSNCVADTLANLPQNQSVQIAHTGIQPGSYSDRVNSLLARQAPGRPIDVHLIIAELGLGTYWDFVRDGTLRPFIRMANGDRTYLKADYVEQFVMGRSQLNPEYTQRGAVLVIENGKYVPVVPAIDPAELAATTAVVVMPHSLPVGSLSDGASIPVGSHLDGSSSCVTPTERLVGESNSAGGRTLAQDNRDLKAKLQALQKEHETALLMLHALTTECAERNLRFDMGVGDGEESFTAGRGRYTKNCRYKGGKAAKWFQQKLTSPVYALREVSESGLEKTLQKAAEAATSAGYSS
jgi:hypothetical protein